MVSSDSEGEAPLQQTMPKTMETDLPTDTSTKYNNTLLRSMVPVQQLIPVLYSLLNSEIVDAPEIPEDLWEWCLPIHTVWDPGATSDMGSIFSVAIVDYYLRKRSRGRLFGLWRRPTWPRKFRVANGEEIKAVYEVEFNIPLARLPGNEKLTFNVAAVDTGRKGEQQVPWLFSNESGKELGALVSSRTGAMTFEDPRLEGLQIKMTKGETGHWLFPLVDAFCMLATPYGAHVPRAYVVSDETEGSPESPPAAVEEAEVAVEEPDSSGAQHCE